MSFSISLDGTQLTIHSKDRGNYHSFFEARNEIIRREKTVVINEIIVNIDGIEYLIPNGFKKIKNGNCFADILLDKTLLDPLQHGKEKEALEEKARLAFESSDSVKKLKAKEHEKKQLKDRERIENEEPIWFYSNDADTREGPIAFNEIKALFSDKTISDNTLVWSPKLDEWQEAHKILNKKHTTLSSEKLTGKELDIPLPETKTKKVSNIESSEDLNTNEGEQNIKANTGIGGWLILVAIGIVITPIRYIIFLTTTYNEIFSSGVWEILTTQGSNAYNSLSAPIIMGEMFISSGILIIWLYMGYLFFSKKTLFPKIYIGLAIFSLIFIIVDTFSIQLILPNEPVFDAEAGRELMRGLIMVVIWVPYMLLSKRVKATFIN